MILLPENYYVNSLYRRESRCRPEVTDGVFSRKEENKNNATDGKCEPPKKAAENKPSPPPKVKPEAKSSCPSKPEPAAPQKQEHQPARSCGCTHRHRSARKSKRRPPRSRNPYIIFFLAMYYKQQPGRKITDVARDAGKQWCRMSPENKEVYRKMARLEQKRRQRKSSKRHRRHKCRR